MTWTRKQKLPALHQSGKVKNPDMPEVEQQNYTSTVLKYANLALPFPQLETNAKRVIPAINELYENRTIANPEELADQDPLNTVQIAGTVYKIEGGGGGGDYTAGAGIYFTGDNNSVINADAGRLYRVPQEFAFSTNEGPSEGSIAPCWEDSSTTVDDHTVYQTHGGTYKEPSGDSVCTFTVSGYSHFSVYAKQNPDTSYFRYIVFGSKNEEIDLEQHSGYDTMCRNWTDSDYIGHDYYLNGESCTVQLMYHKESYIPGISVDLNDGQFVDTGTTVDGHPVYKSDAGSYHISNGVSLCTLTIVGVTSFTVYFRTSSEYNYDWAYVGHLDEGVSKSYYKSRLSGTPSYTAVTFECSPGVHTLEIMYAKNGSTDYGDDRAYFYSVVNEYAPTPTDDDRAYAYVVLGTPYVGGEYFNDYANNKATGVFSHAEGESTQATGDNSHAEGSHTKASGNNAHTEGYGTEATASYSHAEGDGTVASETCSHAEGSDTLAQGSHSHAEGTSTKALGYSSHAEGNYSVASGDKSHAEGEHTTASGENSHTEGRETQATAIRAHAEGGYTLASAGNSHAEGFRTQATADSAHAEGYYTKATSPYAHSEGIDTVASGSDSHAEGSHTVASADHAHAEGYSSAASGKNSHAEGEGASAVGVISHAEGYYTKAEGQITHAEGTAVAINNAMGTSRYFTGESSGFCGHIEGSLCGIGPNAAYSHVEGLAVNRYMPYDSSSSGYYHNDIVYLTNSYGTVDTYTYYRCTVAEGYYVYGWVDPINYPQYWEVFDSEDLSAYYKVIYTDSDGNDYYGSSSTGVAGHAEGLATLVTGNYGHSEGNQTKATGVFAHAEGYLSTSSGAGSHTEGNQTLAQGYSSHAEGGGSKAFGTEAHAEGGGTYAYGNWSHAEGAGNYAYASYSHVEGAGTNGVNVYTHTEGAGNANFASYGHVEGSGNKSFSFAHNSHTEGGGNVNGSVQGHIEGSGNQISGEESHLEGAGNKLHGPKTHGEGGGNAAYGIGSHVEGKHNEIAGFAIHAEGTQNLVGTSTTITPFNYGTSYAVGDIVGPNANYVNFNESTSAYLYRCITAPGQIYPIPGNGVEYISPSTWNSSTSYTAGSVVCYPMPNYSGFGYYYCSSDVPAKDTPPPVDGSGWSSITSVLSPFKTTTTYSSSYYLLSTEQEANSGMPIAKVAANITINAMWEAIPTPHSTHIEGYKNIALGDYQHIQGKYNAVDANKAFIIGNGTADNARSNALTVDWSGNTTIAGDLTTGTTLNTTAQTVGAAINEISVRVPAPPVADGHYTLSLTITNGVPTYSWVSS